MIITDVIKIKSQFPIFNKHPHLTYLDNSATSLKPQVVLDKMNQYYSEYGVNIHRGVYSLSYQASDEYEKARQKVADFINSKFEEVVFTKNVTDALNKTALMYSEKLHSGDEIIVTQLEHHSSILPWQNLAHKRGFKLKYIPLTESGRITIDNFKKIITEKSKVLAITYVSNVLGYITPLKEIIDLAHQHGITVIVDAAQAVPHIPIDVKELDCDFLAFSGHKMLGPTGIGVLYGKKIILETLDPVDFGGDMNENVDLFDVEVKDIPYRFEAGTPPIAEVLGLSTAIDFIKDIGYLAIHEHEQAILQYVHQQLHRLEGVTVYNKDADIAVITFNIDGVHPHDASTLFDEREIAVRAGHHCAQLVSKWLECSGTLRASFYIYNDIKDVDKFIMTIKDTVKFFEQFRG